ncbi:response regulator [Paenibacillus nasutitermitis]|uniref:DNA-binding response regulator n=1 Tax=Paenibacillus nasutitermitis TaxID=1652958 RepID=A0A916YJX9_9BACL|nr:response regulator [Paenibacillus nasutitermitis]GGD48531.1 hypothetical protein GCM10010911_02570 [Paenibacillus nasutitermitis]
MIRLLIVDDEPYTVDGLFEMLENTPQLELELYRAYSPEEAVEWMSRTKMDIVLSDIRMPGMTGLELQKWVVGQWPRCKIIFLTGIRELQTAQHAIRTGSVDYILKTEGDEAILRSIRKAMEELLEETRSDQFILQAKEQMHKALPLLHREWFNSLLDPGYPGGRSQSRMRELDIPLLYNEDLIPVIGRVDRWEERANSADHTLLLYAIQNIAAEFFETVVFFSVHLDTNHLVLLIQPRSSGDGSNEAKPVHSADARWRKTGSFVQGTLESVQETCLRLLKLPVSFISPAYPVTWSGLPRAYANMRHQLVLGLGTGVGMLMSVDPLDEVGSSDPLPPVRMMMDKLERLLNEGLEEPFIEYLQEVLARPGKFADYVQIYYSVAALLLAQFELVDPGTDGSQTDLEELFNLPIHHTSEQAHQCFLKVSSLILARRRELQDERTSQVISKLHQYICCHLDGDLSLTRLAEVVYLNPTYLSVLYKQSTGNNLSEYIARIRLEKAKELLETTPLKIHEIAEKVGFETAGYFTRFFKKRLNVTPQEFRGKG